MRLVITSDKVMTTGDFDRLFDDKIGKLSKADKKIISTILSSMYKEDLTINPVNNRKLLDYIGLIHFWEKQLKQGSRMQKQNSLRRFDDLNAKISGSSLTMLAYDTNAFLRKRSRAIYVSHTPNDPFRFFEENFDKEMNEWDRIDLHHALKERSNNSELPNLSRWLQSSDDLDFKCFLIKEIAFFNQQDNCPMLRQMLLEEDKNFSLKESCIKALGELKYKKVERDLIEMYHTQPQRIKDCIIRTIGQLATGEALQFLISVYKEAVEDEKKLVILSVINNYGEEGRRSLAMLKEEEKQTTFSLLMFEHVTNSLLTI